MLRPIESKEHHGKFGEKVLLRYIMEHFGDEVAKASRSPRD